MGVGRDTCPPRVPDPVPGGWQRGSIMGSWGWGGDASSFLSCPLEKTRQGGQGGDFHTHAEVGGQVNYHSDREAEVVCGF